VDKSSYFNDIEFLSFTVLRSGDKKVAQLQLLL